MQFLGIHVDTPFLKTALIKKTRGHVQIVSLNTVVLNELQDVKQLDIEKHKARKISALSSSCVFIKPIELKTSEWKYFDQLLAFHTDATTYMNPNELLSVPYILNKEADLIKTLIFTVPKELLEQHLKEHHCLGIDPDQVSSQCMGLTSYIQWKLPSLRDAFLIDLGSKEWTCVLLEKGKIKKSHAVLMGTESLFSSLWEDRKKVLLPKEVEGIAKQIDLLQLKSNLNPNLSNQLIKIKKELEKIIFSFQKLVGSKPVVFTGHLDAFRHLKEFLLEHIEQIELETSSQEWPLEEKKHAIAIGLGLDQKEDSLQFLKGEFFPKKQWSKAGLYMGCLLACCIFMSSALLIVGNQLVEHRYNNMKAQIQKAMKDWQIPIGTLSHFSKSSSFEDLEQWMLEVDSHKKNYEYILSVPKVSEVISWLSKNPFFQSDANSLELKQFDYALLQYPSIEDIQEPYRAKVELAFKSSNSLDAKKFHESLIHEHWIVDSESEIGWDTNYDVYRVSFFLKNKT